MATDLILSYFEEKRLCNINSEEINTALQEIKSWTAVETALREKIYAKLEDMLEFIPQHRELDMFFSITESVHCTDVNETRDVQKWQDLFFYESLCKFCERLVEIGSPEKLSGEDLETWWMFYHLMLAEFRETPHYRVLLQAPMNDRRSGLKTGYFISYHDLFQGVMGHVFL